MIKQVKDTKYIFEVGDISKMDVDLLYLWTTASLNSGDETFLTIHKEAGSVLYEECIASIDKYGKVNSLNQKYIPAGQSIITNAGNLEQYNVIHCVLPNKKIREEEKDKLSRLGNAISSGIELAKAYSDIDIKLNTVCFYPISEAIYGEVKSNELQLLFETLFRLGDFKKVFFVFKTLEDKKRYEEIFLKLTTSRFERVVNKLFKFDF